MRAASIVGGDQQARRGVGALAAGDDVLGGAAEEDSPQEVEAGVHVEVHRGRREQDEREAERRDADRDEAAGEPDRAVEGVDEPELGVDVGGLDFDLATLLTQPLGEPIGSAALGVRSRQPALERAQLADDFHAVGRVHGRDYLCGGWDSNPQAPKGSGF